jgi:hypothetical protein
MVMAFFRAHDAAVTGGQLAKTGIAVTLAETLVGLTITVDAAYHAIEIKLQRVPDHLIKGDEGIAHPDGIADRITGLCRHLAQATGHINQCGQDFTSKY